MLLSFAASAEDPISGGRHKVIGSKPLFIPPQTSTIASHLPKAVGAAFSIGIARTLRLADTPLPADSVVLCSVRRRLGQSFDRAGRVQHRRLGRLSGHADAARLRLRGQWHRHFDEDAARLDRGVVPRPRRARIMSAAAASIWSMPIAARARRRASRASMRQPVFLHMETVRLYGHAGSDMQAAYRDKAAIERDEERDPLLASAALLIEQEVMNAAEVARSLR